GGAPPSRRPPLTDVRARRGARIVGARSISIGGSADGGTPGPCWRGQAIGRVVAGRSSRVLERGLGGLPQNEPLACQEDMEHDRTAMASAADRGAMLRLRA